MFNVDKFYLRLIDRAVALCEAHGVREPSKEILGYILLGEEAQYIDWDCGFSFAELIALTWFESLPEEERAILTTCWAETGRI